MLKNMVSSQFKFTFDLFIDELKEYGYNVYYQVLNAKNYGIPQDRERVFCFIIRQDLDSGNFKFPEPIKLTKDLSDFINFREVDDLTENFYKRYCLVKGEATHQEFVDYINGLPTRRGIGTKTMGLYDFNEMDTITTTSGITGTITCRNSQNYNKKYLHNDKLYKPSPKMCFNLMGFSDEDFKKVSDHQDRFLYDAAGNSIVVNVLYHVYLAIYKSMPYLFDDLKVGSYFFWNRCF